MSASMHPLHYIKKYMQLAKTRYSTVCQLLQENIITPTIHIIPSMIPQGGVAGSGPLQY
jgi:hypothetical protein